MSVTQNASLWKHQCLKTVDKVKGQAGWDTMHVKVIQDGNEKFSSQLSCELLEEPFSQKRAICTEDAQNDM